MKHAEVWYLQLRTRSLTVMFSAHISRVQADITDKNICYGGKAQACNWQLGYGLHKISTQQV